MVERELGNSHTLGPDQRLAQQEQRVDLFTVTAGVLTAALPTAGWVFIFAQRYESDVARISTALVARTALSAATFSALVWYLGLGMGTK
jgi:predicted permease